jgi:hypothetical protein
MAENIIIPLAVFATIFGILYVFLTTRNKERMALIEKGVDASMLNMKKSAFGSSLSALKIGMFLAGLALGLLIGNILAETTRLKEEVAYISMMFLGGGTSLIAFYLIEKKKVKSEDADVR